MLQLVDLRGAGAEISTLLPRPHPPGALPLETVRRIIASVRSQGDAALRRLTKELDGVDIASPRVEARTLADAPGKVDPGLRRSLESAAERIEAFQRRRAAGSGIGTLDVFEEGGVRVETRRLAVRRAGLYVPGGRARYPSTVLMTALLARVAGVDEIVLCVPPGPSGNPPDETLTAAVLCGIDEVYRIGGAQAVAAMAYGTESIPRVDVIVGPGNVFVALAKREVASVVGVPGAFAGPSEVVVVADASVPPELAAIDLAVQAEHGPDGLSWLITESPVVATAVGESLAALVASSPRRADLESTLATGGYCALVEGPDQAVEVIDLIAPEHLELLIADPAPIAERVRCSGVTFCGVHTPASLGDYAAGPSHVLPTNGTARFAGALSVVDFTRESSTVTATEEGIRALSGVITSIARAEGLDAHERSILLRTAD